ncbi:MAG: IreB family regulatory phosphoprotein [Christensenellales bacterium]
MNEKNKIVADSGNTITFSRVGEKETPHEVLMKVYYSMCEKGYDPVSQIVGYLISGDPTYITSYNNARYLIRMFERDELIEELVRTYVEQYNGDDTL